MLSREDSRRLAELERQLRRDDPEFCARIEGAQPLTPPSRRKRFPITLLVTAAVLWTAAIVLGIFTWWSPAAITAACAVTVSTAVLLRARRVGKP
jgi:fatty acid desaturase